MQARWTVVTGLVVMAGLALAGGATAQESQWTTLFEASDGNKTPRYDETVSYCRRLAEASPWLHFTNFGTSPEGRPLPLLIADRDGLFDPEAVRNSGKTVVLIEACIHAGECCGKDAGLMLMRDLTVTGRYRRLLENVTVLFIPIFNVDGHERFGPYNRVNQNGPQEMGWRTTARNLNLNRDFLKADAPEMRDWLRLFVAWLPDFFVDVHSTDGADYQYAITFAMETNGNMDADLSQWAERRYLPFVQKKVEAAGYPVSPYVMFRDWHDPLSGLRSWVASPRLSQGYTALQNRPGLLIEAHMLKDYRTRVRGTYEMLLATLEYLDSEHPLLRQIVHRADSHAANELLDQPLALTFEAVPESVMINFLGFSYERLTSDLTGGEWTRYGDRKETFQIPYFNKQRPSVSVFLPEAYLVPAQWTDVIERLRWHGIALQRLQQECSLEVRSYRFSEPSWQERPYEGRHRVDFEAEAIVENRTFPAGTILVDMRQRAARVAAHILEPLAPDSYVRWGFFDAIFERKEYVEAYVIEPLAQEMLASDPELKQEFAAKLAEDADFAGNAWAIYNWFYERTPYYDSRVNVYPIGLIDDRGMVDSLPVVVADGS